MLNKTRLLTPGPTPLPEEVRLALAKDMIHHRKPDFERLMESLQEKLRLLFGTTQVVLPLACSGTGAMTAAAGSLFKAGEKVLVVEAGKFGERWKEIAAYRNLDIITLEIEWGKCAKAEEIANILNKERNIAGVFLQLCETSTGVLQPVREIAEITARKDTLLVVDGISAVGISPCPMDQWGIDCLLTGSQKGLLLPPGLALIALSKRAWQKAEQTEPACYYFNLPAEKAILEKKHQTHFTSPINLLYGLEASLEILLRDGLEAIYKKQWALTMLIRSGAAALGLELLARTDFSWGVTAIRMPENVQGSDVLNFAQKNYGVYMAGGQDRLKNRIVRIGHMGWVDWDDCLAGLFSLSRGLEAAGFPCGSTNYMEEAMKAYDRALADFKLS